MEFFFGEHHVDVDRRELRRGDDLIAVEPQVFDLLLYLVRNRDRVVSKDDLIGSVWGGRIVSESTLSSHIHAVRKAVGDSGEAQRLIRTLPRKGFRFVGTVEEVQQQARRGADLPSAPPTVSISQPPVVPRLSIVVLPFTNLSDDREQQYFADGITDDVTTDLSRIPHMFVISRNTAFTYKDKPVDTRQIGRELGVRFVLEGSVRRSGKRVRVNAQLIDAETNAHLWAERFDDDTLDVFALQNEITSRIAIALNTELVTAEVARPTVNPDALDYILRGRAAFSKPPTRSSLAETIDWIERALALDPRSAEAQSLLAYVYAFRDLNQMTDARAADMARAEHLVAQALAASPRSPLAHLAKAQVLRAQGRPEEAIPEYETVIASDPNETLAISALGWCKLMTGSLVASIALIEQAIRLSPRDARVGIWYQWIARVHLLQSRIDEAILWLERACGANPGQALVHACLGSAYAVKGEIERATAELAEARRLSSDNRYSSIARFKAAQYFGVPKIRALHEATFFAGLRKAGMPEE